MYYLYDPYQALYPSYYQPIIQYPWGYPVYVKYFPIRQQYPDVDADLFFKSAGAFKHLMADASVILNKLSEDEQLAYKIMDEAQKNKTEKVKELIESTGVQGDVDVDYNPDGLNLTMHSQVEGTDCCKLTMTLRWR
ncbi:hypothetical protein SAMN05216389_12059 [Oceanobacillus limi]|uniref:Uncharacterized protein n=1 Tax=Oceanobacillus limi TaxID=930131 RepID=A0A1I0GBH6_9BACI|nr:hypothetical protein [Oceanobacillus limi]SET68389.1 hypothetical protein SAMN05216389_12059 [Oceanobacillus limi]